MLSIVVPVYNVEAYLEECLESIARQIYMDYEVIVVDDGSTDRSGQLAERFCAGKEKFRFYRKKNGGLMSAWCYGAEKSQGEYIGFVDSDDRLSPDMYQKMMKQIQSTEADIVMCGRTEFTKSGTSNSFKPEFNQNYFSQDEIYKIHDKVFPSLEGGNVSSARWNKVFKREILTSNIKYCASQSRYCEDRYIVPACLLTARTFAYIPEPLYFYRMRKSANSKKGSDRLLAAIDELYAVQIQMLKDKNLDQKYFSQLELAKINYMKIVFERNLTGKNTNQSREKTLEWLLCDENRRIVLGHRNECQNSKFGKCLYWAENTRRKEILSLGAFLLRGTRQTTSSEWFE